MDKAMDKAKAEAEEIIGMRTLEELEEIEELLDRHYCEGLPHQTYLLSAFVIMVNLSSAQSSIEVSKSLAQFNVPEVKELLDALKATQAKLKPLLRAMLNL